MTSRSGFLDGGAYNRTAFCAINKSATAQSTGDGTEVDCAWIDRKHPTSGGFAQSAKLVFAYTTTLTKDKSLKFGVQLQDAPADSAGAVVSDSAADYGDAVASTAVETSDASPNETITGTAEVDINLVGAKQFFRAQVTPDLDASSSDTVEWSLIAVLYGDSRNPSTKAFGTVSA